MVHLSQETILGIHIGVVLFLAFLAWAILTRTQTPKYVGIFILLVVISVVTVQVYFFTQHKNNNSPTGKAQGLHFDPNDPNYKPIGGIGGTGWV